MKHWWLLKSFTNYIASVGNRHITCSQNKSVIASAFIDNSHQDAAGLIIGTAITVFSGEWQSRTVKTRLLIDAINTIDNSRKKSFQYYVLQELHRIHAYLLEDDEVDKTPGSASRRSDKIWSKTALYQHNAGQFFDHVKFYCVGRQTTEDSTVILTSTHLLEIRLFRYNTQIVMDVTDKCSTVAQPPSTRMA